MDEPANIFLLYEQNIGMITPLLKDELMSAEDEYPSEWIVEAVKLAVVNNVRKWSYARAILERWKVNGYKENGKNGNGKHVDYTAGILESYERETPVDPTPAEVREKYRMQVSRFDVVMNDVPRGLRQQFGEMWIARVDGDAFVIACEDEYRVSLARSRLRSTLERALMARVEFECPTS